MFVSGQMIQKTHVYLLSYTFCLAQKVIGITHTVYRCHQVSFEACLKRISPIDFNYLFIYLIHYLNLITRSYKTNLHRASIKP